ncbi:MAG: hypothetical protein ABSD98_18565, partial [Candidatus Korobacteraceae bacterium]
MSKSTKENFPAPVKITHDGRHSQRRVLLVIVLTFATISMSSPQNAAAQAGGKSPGPVPAQGAEQQQTSGSQTAPGVPSSTPTVVLDDTKTLPVT